MHKPLTGTTTHMLQKEIKLRMCVKAVNTKSGKEKEEKCIVAGG